MARWRGDREGRDAFPPPVYSDSPESAEAMAALAAEDRRSIRSMKPWWRRASEWLGEAHKMVTTIGAICLATVGVHVWLKGLITRKELETAVEAGVERAIRDALRDVRADLADLKTNTGGLPAWRADVTIRLVKVEDKAEGAVKQGEKNEHRIDSYFVVARGAR